MPPFVCLHEFIRHDAVQSINFFFFEFADVFVCAYVCAYHLNQPECIIVWHAQEMSRYRDATQLDATGYTLPAAYDARDVYAGQESCKAFQVMTR